MLNPTALEGSMELKPGRFGAVVTLCSACETLFFASWLPGMVPWLCPLLHEVRADPMGFALPPFLAPCPAAYLAKDFQELILPTSPSEK